MMPFPGSLTYQWTKRTGRSLQSPHSPCPVPLAPPSPPGSCSPTQRAGLGLPSPSPRTQQSRFDSSSGSLPTNPFVSHFHERRLQHRRAQAVWPAPAPGLPHSPKRRLPPTPARPAVPSGPAVAMALLALGKALLTCTQAARGRVPWTNPCVEQKQGCRAAPRWQYLYIQKDYFSSVRAKRANEARRRSLGQRHLHTRLQIALQVAVRPVASPSHAGGTGCFGLMLW